MVIAIIAILASFMMPVLRRAQPQAGSLSSINNLKNIGLAQALYATDYKDFIAKNVTNTWKTGTDLHGTWFGLLSGCTPPWSYSAPYGVYFIAGGNHSVIHPNPHRSNGGNRHSRCEVYALFCYTIVIAPRYLEPIVLRDGFVSGFGLYLQDKDQYDTNGCPKGLSLASEQGSHCDYKPYLWPLMILSDSDQVK